MLQGRQEADDHRRHGRAGARRMARRCSALARRSPSSCGADATTGTASTCCTPRRRGSAALDLGFVPGAGGRDVAGILAGAQSARSTWSICSAPTRSTPTRLGQGLRRSIRAITAMPAPHRADVILPGAAYTEKPGTYVNTEGRVQRGAARRLSAGRGARGLDDPARAVERARARRCRTTRSTQVRARLVRGEPGLRRARPQVAPAAWGDVRRRPALVATRRSSRRSPTTT